MPARSIFLIFCLLSVHAFAADGERAPIKLHLLLSSEFRATLSADKMKQLESLGRLNGGSMPSVPSVGGLLGREPRVELTPDPKLAGHIQVKGVTENPFRMLVKPYGNNRSTIESVRRGDINAAGVICLGENELLPDGVGAHDFRAGGRRYAFLWNREALARDWNMPLSQVEPAIRRLGREFTFGLRMAVHDEGAAPHERRKAASNPAGTH